MVLSTHDTVNEAAAALQHAVDANHFGVMDVHNLKCRISIYEEDCETILATLEPTTLLAMFNTPRLAGVAQEVEDTMVKIMKTVAGSSVRSPYVLE